MRRGPVPDGPALAGRIPRPLALIPLLSYGLYLFVKWQDVGDRESGTGSGDIAVGPEWGKPAVGLLVTWSRSNGWCVASNRSDVPSASRGSSPA